MPWDTQLCCRARGDQHIDMTGATALRNVDNKPRNIASPQARRPEPTTQRLSEPKMSPPDVIRVATRHSLCELPGVSAGETRQSLSSEYENIH